ncbi:MAG: hypothetical protein ABL929_08710 [Ferruginibacter sp.]|nr:hypothetical protein [Ferruginibacter sp.]
MALEEFENEKLSTRQKSIVLMQSITNYVMGAVIFAAGILIFFPQGKMIDFVSRYDPTLIKIFGIVCCIYGSFRIFRGYQKKYFR